MKTLTVDSNNDLMLVNNNLAISQDREALMLVAEHAVKAQYGEMILAIQRGIPYNVLVWDRQPNLIQLEAFIRRAILALPNVLNILDFDIAAANHVITYSVTINTTYGVETLNDLRISN